MTHYLGIMHPISMIQWTSHILAHSVLGAAIAYASGGNELIGAITAGGAEAAAPALAKFLYGRDSRDLSADEKSTISAVVGLGGAVLGSFAGDLREAMAGSSIAKNAVDNNWGEVGHYSTMATVLYLAGFSERDAKAIALAAWSPDTDYRNAITEKNIDEGNLSYGYQQTTHLLDGETDPNKVAAKQEELSAEVAKILASIKDNQANPAAKAGILSDPETQRILHAFGDSFAHVKKNGEHYPGVYGHLLDLKEPDNPDDHPEAYAKYVSALYGVASATTGNIRGLNSGTALLSATVSSRNTEEAQKAVLAAFARSRGSIDPWLVKSPLRGCETDERCGENAANRIINGLYGIWDTAPPKIDWNQLPRN
ncbi:VENN motif pre-toxin domain-containing protein [Xanthomonas nasturtii]|uniref:VENN motif pre-toxin domain-containing protein n=1 Tax=Xanthomonas nasturtii TaxID=1843581 RepID=A0ABT0LS23_9XANT|nr:VENN motif pre-toxin domain-containing protein [Xanthomonas nasturtii]MCL1552150.1 VENN motif pre-toxin domain-containing protein [Xanthomonas nasturtii]MCL1556389.1 VENN motif pre-toxin domain-containing protein [Xanthomonas nasturtii]